MHTASGKRLDATQEMMALGMANFLGSFFGSFPITASFGRSSVQAASGVRTPFANVYGGILIQFLKLTSRKMKHCFTVYRSPGPIGFVFPNAFFGIHS